jgi:hypothetical protein
VAREVSLGDACLTLGVPEDVVVGFVDAFHFVVVVDFTG